MEAVQAEYASICLLSYERPDFLRRTLTSAVKNAGHPVEVIVHDDGSKQETLDVLLELHRNHLISLLMLNAPGVNEGQGVALNRMFEAATGDPIVKMDQDLEFEPEWLAKCVALLHKNYHVEEAQERIGCLGLFRYPAEPVRYEDMLIRSALSADVRWDIVKDFVGSCMVIPRRAYEKFGPFETRSEAFAEDYEFKMKVAEEPHWCNALYGEELATNFGFGMPHSTVVVEREGELTSREIAKGPMVIGKEFIQ